MRRLDIYDVNVDDATNEELLTLTSQICCKSKIELQTLLAEAEKLVNAVHSPQLTHQCLRRSMKILPPSSDD